MLKEKDGKIVVPKRFIEWLEETKKYYDTLSVRIVLINRTNLPFSKYEIFDFGVLLSLNDNSFHDLADFVLRNKQYLTLALLENKPFIAEEEKKYYMVAPDGFDKSLSYLNFDTNDHDYYLGDTVQYSSNKNKFTQSEIDAMPQKFRDFFRQVEVEG